MARRSRNEEAAMDSYFYARVRGEIVGTYAQAESDLAEKLRRFTALFEAEDREKRAQLSAGTITKAEYDSWLRGQVFRGERWKAVRQECVDQIHRANETTARMLNGERRALFQKAANYSAYQIEQGTRGAVNFTLYDSATVTRLIQKKPKLLPDLKVGKRRDESWNGRGIQNAITQGIIQGESIPDIAKRIAHQTGERNRAALTRQARTAMTGAQNAGRVQAMWEAEDEGIKIQKKWIATLDRKTRDAHAELDGQVVDADKPFVVNGMEIMYPGDPNADPSLVYNCRCTLGWEYPDYPSAPGARRDNETGEVIGGVTYQQWAAEKAQPRTVLPDEESLSLRGGNGIIELTEEQDRQRFSTVQEIAEHFTVTDKYGERHCMIDTESFGRLEIGTQNRIANAVDYMVAKFPGVPRPNVMVSDSTLGGRIYGSYRPSERRIAVNPALVKTRGQDYATAVHEMAHHYNHVLPGTSRQTISAALQSCGLRRNGRKADFAIADIVGYGDKAARLDDGEIIAKALEKNATGNSTPLSMAIEAELIRRMK